MRRVAIVLSVALPLSAVDLWIKAVEPTESWAYHQRSPSWLLLSLTVLAATVIVTRIPSPLVPPAAGVLAGGVLGNTLSALWNGMAVPNPLMVTGSQSIVAFNLADVWSLAGIFLLTSAIGIWLVRNRHLLPTTAQSLTACSAALRRLRRPAP
jgi:xanthine/uracil permease